MITHVVELSLFLDDKFLLQFLRTKKYRMDKTKDLLEGYLLLKNSVPRWYDFNDDNLTRMWSLYESGVAYPLAQRDSEGRRIILVQAKKFDPKVFNWADAMRLLAWVAKVILEEEETQISGIITILDHADITFSHMRLVGVNDAIDFVTVIKQAVVGRLKGMYMVALPSFASFMLELVKKAATQKLRKRIHVVNDMETMKTLIDPSLFPSELGGSIPESQMMESFKKLANERDEVLRSIQEGVDWDRVALDGESSCAMM